VFEKGTGQLINPLKCSMLFGKNCSNSTKEKVLDILQVPNLTVEEKYLGLGTPEGRMCKDKFKTTKQRLVKRCSNWVEKNMSMAAKEVLIKSVAQAIPTYLMGVFKLPAGACDEITQIIRRFWWGEEGGKRKVHWIPWDKLLASKSKGGMGFRDMRKFNQALLARQAWRLVQFPESLCARVLRAKYFPNGELVDTVFTGNASPTWRSIEYGLELLKQGIVWRVGRVRRSRYGGTRGC
jgi:hypothetical protein